MEGGFIECDCLRLDLRRLLTLWQIGPSYRPPGHGTRTRGLSGRLVML